MNIYEFLLKSSYKLLEMYHYCYYKIFYPTLDEERMEILSNYVFLAYINKICKYCHTCEI